MKIGIDIRTLQNEYYSGIPEYTYNLVRCLLEYDKKNKYVFFANSFRDVRLPDIGKKDINLVKTAYPNKLFNYVMQKGIAFPKLDQLLGGVDLFFMPHFNFSSFSGNCRKIITVHDLSFVRNPKFFSIRKNLWHYLVNVRKQLSLADDIIAISESTRRDLIELCGQDPKKIKVIYSGIDPDIKRLNDAKELSAVRKKYGLPDRFVLFVGTLEPRKNVTGLIRAFESYAAGNRGDNIHLVLAGARGWKSKKIMKAISGSRFNNRIKWLGYIDRDDKSAVYSLAEVFVFPSFYEGFGFPPLEAMSCGTPTITSNVTSLPEVVGNASIMIDPYNTGEMAEALKQVLKDPGLRSDLSVAGMQRAGKFSWSNSIRRYLALFD